MKSKPVEQKLGDGLQLQPAESETYWGNQQCAQFFELPYWLEYVEFLC